MPRLLVVEDSKFFSSVLRNRLVEDLGVDVVVAASRAEALAALEEAREDPFYLALLDLTLPDAPDGEVIEDVVKAGVPSVVFTSRFDDEIRERLLGRRVIDYVLKDNPASLDYVVSLAGRILRNRDTKVLVVDDSKTARAVIARQLRAFQLQVLEAGNGAEALEILGREKDLRLIVTDYEMDGIDGFELVKRVRADFKRDELAIIGMSAQGNNVLSAKFIKHGANDFIIKPFVSEEFLTRVSQNLDMLERIEQLRFAATRDFLTGLYNRRHFFETAAKMLEKARRDKRAVTVAMMDIDHFKRVNDTYGHDGGDVILQGTAQVLREHFEDDALVARFGGEEFCVLSIDLAPSEAFPAFEKFRKAVEAHENDVFGKMVSVTQSVGLSISPDPSRVELEYMLTDADKCLYQAKEGGRNRVMMSL